MNLDEVKEAKEREATELFTRLSIEPKSDFDTYNFYHDLNYLLDSDNSQEKSDQKLYWTRLSNNTNQTPTIQ